MQHHVPRTKFLVLLYLFTFLPFYLFLVSCGPEKGRFRIEGQLQNVDQSEFYIYSPDAGSVNLDTIKVAQGRFVYETDLKKLATFILLYPNYSEQVIYGNSGITVELKGDASHLKEVEVHGSEENEQMTEWRLGISQLTPPQVKEQAISFIQEHPGSILSNYILQHYVLAGSPVDYKTGAELAALMLKEQPENGRLLRLEKQLSGLKATRQGNVIPDFKAVDIHGNTVTRQSLKGELNVISVWAKWSFESQSVQRKLHVLQRKYGSRLGLLSINLDGNTKACRDFLDRDSIHWSNVCDGNMWDTPIVADLGFYSVPGNLFLDRQGRVLEVNVPTGKIEEKVKSILK